MQYNDKLIATDNPADLAPRHDCGLAQAWIVLFGDLHQTLHCDLSVYAGGDVWNRFTWEWTGKLRQGSSIELLEAAMRGDKSNPPGGNTKLSHRAGQGLQRPLPNI